MGFLKHAPILYNEQLERLLRVLRRSGGELPWYTLTHCKKFERWELIAAELHGWVRIEKRRRQGSRQAGFGAFVCLEEDTSQARPVPEEWEVPLAISAKHKAFAERTFQFRTLWEAYRATYPKAKADGPKRSRGPKLFRRGSVQAVRAWIIARQNGDIGEDEVMPETVEGIEFRLRGAGWDDARFAQAKEWKRKLSEGELTKRRQKSLLRSQCLLERRATMPSGKAKPVIEIKVTVVHTKDGGREVCWSTTEGRNSKNAALRERGTSRVLESNAPVLRVPDYDYEEEDEDDFDYEEENEDDGNSEGGRTPLLHSLTASSSGKSAAPRQSGA